MVHIRAFLIVAAISVFAGLTASPMTAANAENLKPGQSSAIQQVIEDQLSAFKTKDGERAYSHAAPTIKQFFGTVEKFMTMVQRGYGPIYDSSTHVFGRNIAINSQIHQEVIFSDQNGKQWQAIYTLKQQEDGSWKITGVKMNPYSGTTT